MYCARIRSSGFIEGLRLSDAEYNKFAAWVKTQDFTYSDQMEKRADDLICGSEKMKSIIAS